MYELRRAEHGKGCAYTWPNTPLLMTRYLDEHPEAPTSREPGALPGTEPPAASDFLATQEWTRHVGRRARLITRTVRRN